MPLGELRKVRGKRIAMVFQDPMSALNPLLAIGTQIDEVLVRHTALDRAQRRARIIELLGQVGIPKPAERLDRLPHEFSGGQRQRVALARALVIRPPVLLLDEPTSGLDPSAAAEFTRLLQRASESGVAILATTHDLFHARQTATRVGIMKRGRLVDSLDSRQIAATDLQALYLDHMRADA
ncbi:hypothetical protein G6F64_013747 [Rhizopus arrhizus]|uniref:ABC transporter domain-containing protein n=1 Tax=Rhizopus oryzae TaxID=64495 RepID=A0A9P6WUP1_RHIOR|nr:hypothetical protein G6F64_013747 [Rhizopus arrhizus]